MFNGFKRLYAINRAYSNMTTLFTDYLSLFNKANRDYKFYGPKLNAFCEYFIASYNEFMIDKPDSKIDDIFSDCNLILSTLIEFVNITFKADALPRGSVTGLLTSNSNVPTNKLNKDRSNNVVRALSVIEIILRHNKYISQKNDVIVAKFVDFLQPLLNSSALQLILKILRHLSKNPECKTIVYDLNGFPKIFALLVDANDELQKEILKTFHAFLELNDTGSVKDVPATGSKFSIPKWGQQILSQLPQSAIYPIQRLFYSSMFERQQQNSDKKSSYDSTEFLISNPNLPPSFEAVASILGTYPETEDSLSAAFSLQESMTSPTKIVMKKVDSAASLKSLSQSGSPLTISTPDTNIKEPLIIDTPVARTQGFMRSLLDTLIQNTPKISVANKGEATPFYVQMDMFGTIAQLLIGNTKNQAEFKKNNGIINLLPYFNFILGFIVLTQFLLKYDCTSDCIKLLDVFFCAISSILISGNSTRLVSNTDALVWILELATGLVKSSAESFNSNAESSSIPIPNHISNRALKLLSDTILMHPLNAAILKKYNGETLLRSILERYINNINIKSRASSPSFDFEEKINNTSEGNVFDIIEKVDLLLCDIAVALTFHDHDIPTFYIELLESCSETTPLLVKHLLVRTVAIFARHFGLFGVDIDDKLVKISTQCLSELFKLNFSKLSQPTTEKRISVVEQPTEQNFDSFSPTNRAPSKSGVITNFDGEFINQISNSWISQELDPLRMKLMLEVMELIGQVILTQNENNTLEINELIFDELDAQPTTSNKWWSMSLKALLDFQKCKGVDLLFQMVHPAMPSCLVEMALYLLQRFVLIGALFASDSINFWEPMVKLLRQDWYPLHLRLRILKSIVSVLHNPSSLFLASSDSINPILMNNLQIKFASSGGLLCLLHILDFCSIGSGIAQYVSVKGNWDKELKELVTVTLFAIEKSVLYCDTNKLYIGQVIGFDKLAEIIKRSSVGFDMFLFDVMYEIATTTPPALLPSLNTASIDKADKSLKSDKKGDKFGKKKVLTDMQRLEILPPSDAIPIYMSLCWSTPVLPYLHSLSNPQFLSLYSDKLASNLLDDWMLMPCTSIRTNMTTLFEGRQDTVPSFSFTPRPHIRQQSDNFLNSLNSPDLRINSHQQSPSSGIFQQSPQAFESIGRMSRATSEVSMHDLSNSMLTFIPSTILDQSDSSISESSNIVRARKPSTSSTRSGDSDHLGQNIVSLYNTGPINGIATTLGRFHNKECALMMMLLIPHAPLEIQKAVIRKLSQLLKANPWNKYCLSQIQLFPFILKLFPRFHEDVMDSYLELSHSIGNYDLASSDIRLLFEFALLHPEVLHSSLIDTREENDHNVSDLFELDPQFAHDLQMQMLFIIGRTAERTAPLNYFNFDGISSALKVPQFDRFPSGKYGYTFTCWMSISAFFKDIQSPNLLTWFHISDSLDESAMIDLKQYKGIDVLCFKVPVLEIFFNKIADSNSYNLAFKSRASEMQEPFIFIFDKYLFSEQSSWHHLALSHSSKEISLFIDGILIQSHIFIDDTCYLPYTSTDQPLSVMLATPLYSVISTGNAQQVDANIKNPEPVSNLTTSFLGQVGLIYFIEGILDAKQICKLFEAGSLFHGEFESCDIKNRILSFVDPIGHAPIGYHKRDKFLSPPLTGKSEMGHDIDLFFLDPVLAGNNSIVSIDRLPFLSLYHGIFSKFRFILADSNNLSGFDGNSSFLSADALTPNFYRGSMSNTSSSSHAYISISQTIMDSYTILSDYSAAIKLDSSSPSFFSSCLLASISLAASSCPVAPVKGTLIPPPTTLNVHITRSIKQEIHGALKAPYNTESLGFFLLFPFLCLETAQQIAALRILATLIDSCPINRSKFDSENGFFIIGHLISSQIRPIYNHRELNIETFDILLEMTHGNLAESIAPHDRKLNDLNGLQLIIDLCRQCDVSTRAHVISAIADCCFHQVFNVKAWRKLPYGGMLAIVELLRMSPDLLPSLLIILNQVLKLATLEDINIIIQFLLADQLITATTSSSSDTLYAFVREKAAISELLRIMWVARPDMLISWIESYPSPLHAIYLLMDHALESVRIDFIKLVGMMIEYSSKYKQLLGFTNGYEMISAILIRYGPLSLAVGETLLRVGISYYKCDINSTLADKKLGGEEDKVDYSKHLISNVECFQVIFYLLKFTPLPANNNNLNANIHIVMIGHIDLLCEKAENMDRLLDHPDFWTWVHDYWLKVFYSDIGGLSNKLSSLFEKLLLHDISRDKSKTPTLRKFLIETPNFLLFLIGKLIHYFCNFPSLPESGNFAYNTLYNLYYLLYKLEETVELTTELLVRIVKCINLIASQNTPAIRRVLINSGLLNVRESFILYTSSLLLTLTPCDQLEILNHLSFDSVVSSRYFRESCAINLLGSFHGIQIINDLIIDVELEDDSEIEQLDYAIIELMRSQFCSQENLLIYFAKIIQDPLVLQFVFPHINIEWESSTSGCLPFASSSPGGLINGILDDATATILNNYSGDAKDFLTWYKSSEQMPRRKSILDRIKTELSSVWVLRKKENERLAALRDQMLQDRLLQLAKKNSYEAASNDILSDKLPLLRERILSEYATSQQKSTEARLERIYLGEWSWDKVRQVLIESGYIHLPVTASTPTIASPVINVIPDPNPPAEEKLELNLLSLNINNVEDSVAPNLMQMLSPLPGVSKIPAFSLTKASPFKQQSSVSRRPSRIEAKILDI